MGSIAGPATPREPGEDGSAAHRRRGYGPQVPRPLRRRPAAPAGRDSALSGQARRRVGHRDRAEGGAVRQARRVVDLQRAEQDDLPRAGERPQLHEGVPGRRAQCRAPAPRLAPLFRGAGAQAGLHRDRDRHRAASAARGGGEVLGQGPGGGRRARSGRRVVPVALLAQADGGLRVAGTAAHGRGGGDGTRRALPALRDEPGVPAAALSGGAAHHGGRALLPGGVPRRDDRERARRAGRAAPRAGGAGGREAG